MNNRNFIASIWQAEINDPTVKYVLVALAQNATRDGVVRMSIDKLTTTTELDELSIYSSILTLQTEGWLTVQIGTAEQVNKKQTEYLASLISAVKLGHSGTTTSKVPNEPWFFCINRSVGQTRSAIA